MRTRITAPTSLVAAWQGASQKMSTVVWFVRRPPLYREFGRALVDTVSAPFRSSDDEVRTWCVERAVSPADAIEALTGSPPEYNVRERYADEFAEALASVQRHRAIERPGMPLAGAGDVDLNYWLARRIGAECVVETGVAYGYSSLALLTAMRDRPTGRLISTDMPLPRTTGGYVGAAVPTHLRDRWTLLTGTDRAVLDIALDQAGSIDLCHYDSDKSASGRSWAYPRLWAHLRPGGVFISDDIDDNAAFREFCSTVDREPIVVASDGKHVGVIVKPAENNARRP